MYSHLNERQRCNFAIKQTLPWAVELQHSGSRQEILSLCTVLLRLYLQCYTQFGAAQCKRGTESAASPAETHQDAQGAGAHNVREESKRVCLLSQEGHLIALSHYPKSSRVGGDRLLLKVHSRWAEATGTWSGKENHMWLEKKEIFRVAQPRHRCPESLQHLHPWRYSHGQGHKQHNLTQKSTCFELEWDSKTQEITLSFSSYHSLFMKRKVTLQ